MQSIKVDTRITPRYGDVLIGLGSLMKCLADKRIYTTCAREEIINFLMNKEIKSCDKVEDIINSYEVDEIVYRYTNRIAPFIKIQGTGRELMQEIPVDIDLIKFYENQLWPIMVKKYISEIPNAKTAVEVKIEILQEIYLKTYGKSGILLFFQELKEILLYNSVIIAEAKLDNEYNFHLRTLIPVPKFIRITF